MRRGPFRNGEIAKFAKRWAKNHLDDMNYQPLAALLRKWARRGYLRGYDDGYSAGHEDQMKARILDAQERRP